MKNKDYKEKIAKLEEVRDKYRKEYFELERKVIFAIAYLKDQKFDVEKMYLEIARKESEIDIE